MSWQCTDVEEMPDSAVKALKSCNPEYYPIAYALLKNVCTLPITTSSCNTKTYLRATMGQERMIHLALIHIHYDAPLNIAEIIDRFAIMYPRRMAL